MVQQGCVVHSPHVLALVLLLAITTSAQEKNTTIQECIAAIRDLNYYVAGEKWQQVANQDTAKYIVRTVYDDNKRPGNLYTLIRFMKHVNHAEHAFWLVTALKTSMEGAEHEDPVAWLDLAQALRRYVLHKAPVGLEKEIVQTQDELRNTIVKQAKQPLVKAVQRGDLGNQDNLLRMMGSESLEMLKRVLQEVTHETCKHAAQEECAENVIKMAVSKGGVLRQMVADMTKHHGVLHVAMTPTYLYLPQQDPQIDKR